MAEPIVLDGKRVGTFKASWLLTKEAFRFLRADTELFLVPIVATLILTALFAILILIVLATGMVSATPTQSLYTIQSTIFLIGSYILSAYVVALAKGAVTHTVVVRVNNGNATLGESLRASLWRTPALVLWALISSTVGLLLRQLTGRSEFMSRLLTGMFGVAWNIATYFVVPAIMIEKKGVFTAMSRSVSVFKQTWGETLTLSISLSLFFVVVQGGLLALFIGSLLLTLTLHQPAFFLAGTVLWIIFASIAFILQSVLSSIVTTLLYVYATASVPPQNFNNELLAQIMVRTMPVVPTVPTSINS
jgi:Family of unknown function (DUF6159)